MNKWVRIVLIALLAGIVNTGTAVVGIFTENPDLTFQAMKQSTVVVLFVGFVVQIANDMLSNLRKPPEETQ